MSELSDYLSKLGELQALVKQTSMIYDYSRKCHMAHVYNLSSQSLFNMPYVEYRPLLDRYMDDIYTRPELPI